MAILKWLYLLNRDKTMRYMLHDHPGIYKMRPPVNRAGAPR